MNLAESYRRILFHGAVVLLAACVVSHWAVSSAVLHHLAATDHPRIKELLGHEDWLDERGMFATPLRERVTWGVFLALLAGWKLVASARAGQTDFRADGICALLGTVLGALLAFVSHLLTYGAGVIVRREIVASGVAHSMLGLLGGLLLAGVAILAARLKRSPE